MSLRKILNNKIREVYPEILSSWEVNRIANAMNKKISNAERRLRPSESPRIETIYGGVKKKVVVGYRYRLPN